MWHLSDYIYEQIETKSCKLDCEQQTFAVDAEQLIS